MIRGTTAQYKFKLPCTKDELVWATIKFWQSGNSGTTDAPLPITKRLYHCSSPGDSHELCVSLAPEETMRFSEKLRAQMQFRAQRDDGTVFGNRTKYIVVYPMHDDILDEDESMLPGTNGDDLVVFDAGAITEQSEDKEPTTPGVDHGDLFAFDAGSIVNGR